MGGERQNIACSESFRGSQSALSEVHRSISAIRTTSLAVKPYTIRSYTQTFCSIFDSLQDEDRGSRTLVLGPEDVFQVQLEDGYYFILSSAFLAPNVVLAVVHTTYLRRD